MTDNKTDTTTCWKRRTLLCTACSLHLCRIVQLYEMFSMKMPQICSQHHNTMMLKHSKTQELFNAFVERQHFTKCIVLLMTSGVSCAWQQQHDHDACFSPQCFRNDYLNTGSHFKLLHKESNARLGRENVKWNAFNMILQMLYNFFKHCWVWNLYKTLKNNKERKYLIF